VYVLGHEKFQTSRTLPKIKRLRKRREFLRVQRSGSRSFGRFVVVVYRRAHDPSPGRIGITVPKKVGPAHERNKIKRRIRHIFRLRQELFENRDIVVIARSGAALAAFSDLQADVLDACGRIKQNPIRRHHFVALEAS
jgi:ribonuclease P protein component